MGYLGVLKKFFYFVLLIIIFQVQALVENQTPAQRYQHGEIAFELHELEKVPLGELQAIESTNELFERFFASMYSNGTIDESTGLQIPGTRRGVHPRAHGCVEGTLTVLDDLWEDDQTAVFRPGKIYQVKARFSNADPRGSKSDYSPDARGVALKLYDVPGPHILPEKLDPEQSHQVFSFNSSDRFFADSAERYRDFMEIALFEASDFQEAAVKYVLQTVSRLHLSVANRIRLAFQGIKNVKASNPVGLDYFSISVFQHGLGRTAPSVKYGLFPCNGPWYNENEIEDGTPYFLRKGLIKTMKSEGACFKFAIQRNPEKRLEIEDITQSWPSFISPFETIAIVHFPAQDLLDNETCERETFNPWTSNIEHRPLGGINRMRLGSYLHSIQSRRRSNK